MFLCSSPCITELSRLSPCGPLPSAIQRNTVYPISAQIFRARVTLADSNCPTRSREFFHQREDARENIPSAIVASIPEILRGVVVWAQTETDREWSVRHDNWLLDNRYYAGATIRDGTNLQSNQTRPPSPTSVAAGTRPQDTIIPDVFRSKCCDPATNLLQSKHLQQAMGGRSYEVAHRQDQANPIEEMSHIDLFRGPYRDFDSLSNESGTLTATPPTTTTKPKEPH
ncbi:hypothetical protein BC629DRAFT_1439798 [Irpex lacteus]|nr:hypothetical protein BC629DRAFT_1439798 [Irpex lacteus]